MTHSIVSVLATVLIATCVATDAATVSPIWMAPTNLNYPNSVSGTFDANIWENFTANLGEWATIEVATGSRGFNPLSVMDSKGIIWIFGGSMDRSASYYLTAVWNFNPKTNQYRYVWKTSNSSPFTARDGGQLRVPAITNHPGNLGGGTTAIDKDDNIWFYTTDYKYSGELWMFNTTSWMFVRQSGPASNNKPSVGAIRGQPGEDVWPGKNVGQCVVIDSNNNLWMLAGQNANGFISSDITNSVWHFNTTSFLWTFIAGSLTQINTLHNSTFYGGAQMVGCDIDDNDRVWIYGGFGASNTDSGFYGDLWSFDTRTKRDWEFEYGENTFGAVAVVASDDYNPGNIPPAANGPVLVDRRDGTLMLVPGYSQLGAKNLGGSNMVWQYSKSLKQWRLVYGDTSSYFPQGKYTNFRTPGSSMPGNIYVGYAAGKHTNGDLYLIGGVQYIPPNSKDIWLIPQDQCSNNLYTCGDDAECVEEMIGYSCKCKDGFSGDGYICTAVPIAPVAVPVAQPVVQPVADAPLSSEVPTNAPSTKWTTIIPSKKNTTTSTPVKVNNTPSEKTSGSWIVGNSVAGIIAVALAFLN